MSGVFDTKALMDCYARGVFPMADSIDDPHIYIIDPDLRGVIELDEFHIPKRLARTVRSGKYRITVDTCFPEIMMECARQTETRDNTWINAPIFNLYCGLHEEGHAHSIEVWQEDLLVGGLYGVELGQIFFGESMFSRARDASKVALVHLVTRLKVGGYKLLDTQFMTAHLSQFGAKEIDRRHFQERLKALKDKKASF